MLDRSSGRAARFGAAIRRILSGVLWVITIGYPFLVWYFLDSVPPRSLALIFAVLFLLRLLRRSPKAMASGVWLPMALACIAFLLAAALINQAAWLLAYPVFVSLLFFTVFFYSLFYPPTIVERIARFEDPDLPPKGVAYTRKVTQVWSMFFLGNALVSLATVWYGDHGLWSLYNGCVFYVLMGLLMAGEMAVRRKVRASF